MRNPRNAGISAILRFPRDPSDLTDLTDLRLPAVGLASLGILGLVPDSQRPEIESTRRLKRATLGSDNLQQRFA